MTSGRSSDDSDVVSSEVASSVPRGRRRAQTREQIMAAALEVFAHSGVRGASVEEISKAAGFSRGAFYSSFHDKDALVLALLQAGKTGGRVLMPDVAATDEQDPGGRAPTGGVCIFLQTLSCLLDDHLTGEPTSRSALLAREELMLHAARVPTLLHAYTRLREARRQELCELVSVALDKTGVELSLPLETAVELMVAAHRHAQDAIILGDAHDPGPLRSLVMGLAGASSVPAS